ncbi:predicted protein [Histoplasma capsulatum var. duboisii H88]|uniref:Predicted protein n=1 Tax=Ajellomyces capsulatus (strain H88) TaxID=544711 RepID=F0UHG3_AJEC8|nr:predicted protein [Histoplasma capsulatum var. duboisii H88]
MVVIEAFGSLAPIYDSLNSSPHLPSFLINCHDLDIPHLEARKIRRIHSKYIHIKRPSRRKRRSIFSGSQFRIPFQGSIAPLAGVYPRRRISSPAYTRPS